MTRAIRFARTGGPEVLELEEITLPEPKPGEALVRHRAIGVNFIDTYHRSGLYPVDARDPDHRNCGNHFFAGSRQLTK